MHKSGPLFVTLWICTVLSTHGEAFEKTHEAGTGVLSTGSGNTALSVDGMDCTEVSIEYEEDPTLTAEENLAAMDAAFQRSLSRFDYCSTLEQSSAPASAAGGSDGGGGPDGQNGEGPQGRNTGTEKQNSKALDGPLTGTETSNQDVDEPESRASTTSSDLSGTEKPARSRGTAPQSGEEFPDPERAETTQAEAVKNGTVPKDIPAADNDSVFEAQLRRAAMEETDPQQKERLWNEYRKYKGLPEKKPVGGEK